MSVWRAGCVDNNSIDCRFGLNLSLMLLDLLLLILRAGNLIVVGSKFSRNLAVECGKLCVDRRMSFMA